MVMMVHIALWEPEIPPNTGNVARLCAATSTSLHLIGRLGFRIDDRSLRRAGLDYWEAVQLYRHSTFADFEETLAGRRLFCFSARAVLPYTTVSYQEDDCLLFGSESRGLPREILERYPNQNLCIPMPGAKVRSLNLATAVGIALYEGLRQIRSW